MENCVIDLVKFLITLFYDYANQDNNQPSSQVNGSDSEDEDE